jgi:hypothetical protein
MKIIGWITTDYAGCVYEEEIEIPDEDLEDMTSEERNDYLEELVKEVVFQNIDWGWKEVK